MEISDIENNERLAQLQTLFILFENETLDLKLTPRFILDIE